ncbi:hypothetical protein AB1Y20_014462 [Prymnesium parvum]|uniref:Acyltransferase 3 domain-containing protein n=1 Tax=Prymnesium parvum TaxID=97485 RepID=A0AB34IGD9_PRYPA
MTSCAVLLLLLPLPPPALASSIPPAYTLDAAAVPPRVFAAAAAPHHHHPAPLAPCSYRWWIEECHPSASPLARWLAPLLLGVVCAAAALLLAAVDRRVAKPAAAAAPSPLDSPRRVQWLDNAKLFAMCGVGIGHFLIFAPEALSGGRPAAAFDPELTYLEVVLAVRTLFIVSVPLFFVISGAVCKPEVSRRSVLSNVVGLLVPPILIFPVKAAFLHTNLLDWRVGVPFAFDLLPDVSRAFDASAFWVLPVMFLLRVVYMPFICLMHTPYVILVTFCTWACFALTTTSSITDGSIASKEGSLLSATCVFLPYFVAGFLARKHRLIERFLQFAEAHHGAVVAIRCCGVAVLVAQLAVTAVRHQEPWGILGVSGDGCVHRGGKISDLARFPFPDRLPDFGCVLAYQAYVALMTLITLLVLPYHRVPFFTKAGTRTITAYLFLQVQWEVATLVERTVAAAINDETRVWVGTRQETVLRLPYGWVYLGLAVSVLVTLALSSEMFFSIVHPISVPQWALAVIDPVGFREMKEAQGVKDDPQAARSCKWHSVLTFLAGGFFMNAIASTN